MTSRSRGFTLIEVLLATALLAAALALGFATLSAATATVNRSESLARDNERMRAVANFLRTRIASARAIGFATDPDSGTPVRFIGSADRMRFVADLPDYLGRGGPYLHDISVTGERGRAGMQVVFRQVQNATAIDEAGAGKPELLADGLASVQFRYRALDDQGALGEWQDEWKASDRLPLQVSVRVAQAGGVAWPELVIALPAASGGAAPGGGSLD
ncbi:MAG: prepilin-type N-terminal cleavage/methylation domain-containing protein [Luteimonas sp.]